MFIPKSLLFWNSLEVRKKYRTIKKNVTLQVSIVYIYHFFLFFVVGDDKVELKHY